MVDQLYTSPKSLSHNSYQARLSRLFEQYRQAIIKQMQYTDLDNYMICTKQTMDVEKEINFCLRCLDHFIDGD